MEQVREHQAGGVAIAAPVPAASAVLAAGPDRGPEGTVSGDLVRQLRVLEEMKSAISSLQAKIAVAFDVAQRQEQARNGVPASERGKGVAAQVALARRESPNKGSRLLGLAKALVTEMPHTMAALESGQLNEWRATLLVKETACLSVEDRGAVDAELAPDAGTFDGAGDKAITAAVKAAAYRRDPRTVTERAAHAASERYVSLRPAPDTGELLASDSRARFFPPGIRRFIETRDNTCRTPYCDAPILHLDHIVRWHSDGPTTVHNGAGLCEACNQTKEIPGWKSTPEAGNRRTLKITTPTGHSYQSQAPPLPGYRPGKPPQKIP